MVFFFFFNDTATTEIYTLSLHDALPIWIRTISLRRHCVLLSRSLRTSGPCTWTAARSEEHTSELQSQSNLVCRLLLEKKKKSLNTITGRRILYSCSCAIGSIHQKSDNI